MKKMKKVIIFIITDIIVLAGFAIIKNSIHTSPAPSNIVAKIKTLKLSVAKIKTLKLRRLGK